LKIVPVLATAAFQEVECQHPVVTTPGSVLSGGLACDQIIPFLSLHRDLTQSRCPGLHLVDVFGVLVCYSVHAFTEFDRASASRNLRSPSLTPLTVGLPPYYFATETVHQNFVFRPQPIVVFGSMINSQFQPGYLIFAAFCLRCCASANSSIIF
jgi:hypothetical protein